MKFMIEIDCSNAAFVEDGAAAEVARILRKEADRLAELGPVTLHNAVNNLRDVNGNKVGCAKFVRS